MENAAAVNEAPSAGRRVGQTCHQCRQRFPTFEAVCKNIRGNKQCPLKYCRRCLLNRYGETAEVVANIHDWKCPRCREICNCSEHMKRRGLNPTGRQINNARAKGFSSVLNMMDVNGHPDSNKAASHEKVPALDEGCGVSQKPVENHTEGATHPISEPIKDSSSPVDQDKAEISLLGGSILTSVAGVDLPPEDVGNALQFLEYCKTFGERFEVQDGQPEAVLKDIMAGYSTSAELSSVIQFHIQLLTFMKNLWDWPALSPSDGFHSWLEVLNAFIANSACPPTELASLFFSSNDEYVKLGPSDKLRLLVFLCDESFQTKDMRVHIDDQIKKFYEGKRKAKEEARAAKEKKYDPVHGPSDEGVKASSAENDAPPSTSKQEAIISGLNTESGDMGAELRDNVKLPFPCKGKPDVLRTDTSFVDSNGHVYWNLKAIDEPTILRQDTSGAEPSEKWYGFNGEDAKEVIKYIKLKRVKRRRRTIRAIASTSPNVEDNPNPEMPSCEMPEAFTTWATASAPPGMEGNPNPEMPSCELPEASPSKADKGRDKT